jgi:hypothetical protein
LVPLQKSGVTGSEAILPADVMWESKTPTRITTSTGLHMQTACFGQ